MKHHVGEKRVKSDMFLLRWQNHTLRNGNNHILEFRLHGIFQL